MRVAKIGVITLFLLMAIGGIGGVMLAGYSFILRAGKARASAFQTGDR
ncbi:protein YohO [Salmonella enterica subsp. enterica serovar Infantis]|nr:protein YohO [Salmonella enterica subsp. enterica serovar Infantis]EHP2162714.1 protein YohO [Salmonella enterica subsp. enterica serovar Infantis]